MDDARLTMKAGHFGDAPLAEWPLIPKDWETYPPINGVPLLDFLREFRRLDFFAAYAVGYLDGVAESGTKRLELTPQQEASLVGKP